jgi:hypothetical protein
MATVAQGQDDFDREFMELDAEDRTNFSPALCQIALLNNGLNRYDDILPYDR